MSVHLMGGILGNKSCPLALSQGAGRFKVSVGNLSAAVPVTVSDCITFIFQP